MGKFKIIMFSLAVFSMWGCTPMLMHKFDVRPSKTTVTYGHTDTTNDTIKDAKNDSTTTADSNKESWTVKQEFIWGKNK
tara:strand:+ start:502 stop:738 length:237 start_codon:yes stop_codon:yes gene_type:complete